MTSLAINSLLHHYIYQSDYSNKMQKVIVSLTTHQERPHNAVEVLYKVTTSE